MFFTFSAKAAACAKPSQGQAVSCGFGLAHPLREPEPPQAKPKPRLLGQAGPEHHYVRAWVQQYEKYNIPRDGIILSFSS